MNPFSPCCTDQKSSDFTLYEATERRVYLECPHCGKIQGLEPTEACEYYAETVQSFRDLLAMNVNEREAVEEIIDSETLTVQEMVDRMPEGWTLVSGEYFKLLVEQNHKNCDGMRAAQKELAYRCSVMVDVASMLSGAGSYDHKNKNEKILQAIATLLQYRDPKMDFARNMDTDDIPF